MGLSTTPSKPFRAVRDFFRRLLGRRPSRAPFYKRLLHR